MTLVTLYVCVHVSYEETCPKSMSNTFGMWESFDAELGIDARTKS